MEELLLEIQTFLNQTRETSDEAKEYERLLEEFHQIPPYVERFKTSKEKDQ